MKISREEQAALREVLAHAAAHGYGNLISHLQTAWARHLMENSGLDEETARAATASNSRGYPFQMQQDLLERGEWDETGARYAKLARPAGAKGGSRRKP